MHLIRCSLRREGGFAMVTVMGVMLIVTLLSVAAFAAADGDFPLGAEDKERKQAFAAAEAGIADYVARVTADPDYWRGCTHSPTLTGPNTGPNPSLNRHRPDPPTDRTWVTIPGAGQTAQYSVELLPANGTADCDPADPVGSFIDANSGTFRIRATGRASATSRVRRSVIATFRRRGFLDYIYYTDYETQDPAWYVMDTWDPVDLVWRTPTREDDALGRDVITWATETCARSYWRDGRGDLLFSGQDTANGRGRLEGGVWRPYTKKCREINFYGASDPKDEVRGPMHTNDEILVCGTPVFGRQPRDNIEVSGPRPFDPANPELAPAEGAGWRPNTTDSACTDNRPVVNQPSDDPKDATLGTWRRAAPLVNLPPSNIALKEEALPTNRFLGPTRIRLAGDTMYVTGKRESGTVLSNAALPVPEDGVVFVGDDPAAGACPGYDPVAPYGSRPGCGDVELQGSYTRNATITAENDIILTGNVTRPDTADVMLGLISDDWIRVYHPLEGSNGCPSPGTSATNSSSSPTNMTIHAAILSVKHSFAVDNYWCGASLGTLTVVGAIGQKYRGTVGRGSVTGYIKSYTYDNRLRFRSPPRFLDPVQASWKVTLQVEQVPPEVSP